MDHRANNAVSSKVLCYLQEAVIEDRPRPNAFRILGLLAYADPREIRQREHMLSIQRFRGANRQLMGPLPLPARPGAHQITQAAHRLRSPASRLIDELFWFWPDQALPGLASHPGQILQYWCDLEERSSSWQAMHSLAVFYLARALDYESQAIAGQTLAEKQSSACTACWNRGVRRWRQLQQQENLWRQYTARVEHFNDPRFSTQTVSIVRQSLDELLLRALVALAIRAGRARQSASLQRHLRLIGHAGFDESLRLTVTRTLLIPLAGEIQLLVDSARQVVRLNPESGTQHVRELVSETEPMLDTFGSLLPEDDILLHSVSDELCLALLGFQVECTNVVNDWTDALSALHRIQSLARGQSIRRRLAENIRIVEGNLLNSLP